MCGGNFCWYTVYSKNPVSNSVGKPLSFPIQWIERTYKIQHCSAFTDFLLLITPLQGLIELSFSLGNFVGPPIGGGLVQVRECQEFVLQFYKGEELDILYDVKMKFHVVATKRYNTFRGGKYLLVYGTVKIPLS